MIPESKGWVPAIMFGGTENKLDIVELHIWMTRSIVEKNKGISIIKLHFVVELLQVL
jgi:hypothetical protein